MEYKNCIYCQMDSAGNHESNCPIVNTYVLYGPLYDLPINSTSTISLKEKSLAEQHVDWFLETVRPLLIEHFNHGYKHGREDNEKD